MNSREDCFIFIIFGELLAGARFIQAVYTELSCIIMSKAMITKKSA